MQTKEKEREREKEKEKEETADRKEMSPVESRHNAFVCIVTPRNLSEFTWGHDDKTCALSRGRSPLEIKGKSAAKKRREERIKMCQVPETVQWIFFCKNPRELKSKWKELH